MTDERWHANQSMPFKAAPEAGRAAVFPDGYGRLIFKYAAIFGGFMALIGLVPLAQVIFSYYPYSYYLSQYGFYVLVVAIVWFVWWIIYIKKIEKIGMRAFGENTAGGSGRWSCSAARSVYCFFSSATRGITPTSRSTSSCHC